jgi:hypothetical protein
MTYANIALDLRRPTEDYLIEHIHGPVAVHRSGLQNNMRYSLLSRGLIEPDLQPGDSLNFPKHTRITEDGRKVVAYVLGRYADALVAAGALERFKPIGEPINLPLIKLDYVRHVEGDMIDAEKEPS